MSGFLAEREGLEYDFSAAPPVLVQHGTADPLISADYGRRAVARLGAEGVPVVYREYPMGHQVALESLQDAMAWLALVLAGERPTEPVPASSNARPFRRPPASRPSWTTAPRGSSPAGR